MQQGEYNAIPYQYILFRKEKLDEEAMTYEIDSQRTSLGSVSQKFGGEGLRRFVVWAVVFHCRRSRRLGNLYSRATEGLASCMRKINHAALRN